MKHFKTTITVRDLIEGYINNNQEGVRAYKGKLDVRPAYQREFVYDLKQQKLVIDSIINNYPLSTIHWVKNGDRFEVLDGQQRTLSICEFANATYTLDEYKGKKTDLGFHNFTKEQKEQFLSYELEVNICDGSEDEKLKWFERINIAGEKLTKQELRNAVYTGPWLTDARSIFSKGNCPAYNHGNRYVRGTPIRQDFLETALKWIAHRDGTSIEGYMAAHQHDRDAAELWLYFQSVIDWVRRTFPKYQNEQKGIEWGILYNKFGTTSYNPNKLDEDITILRLDDDVTKKSGIYEYLLSGDEKHLNVRVFTESQKIAKFEEQQGICPVCSGKFEIENMEGDHITPWREGGKTDPDNLQMLCRTCNRRKSGK